MPASVGRNSVAHPPRTARTALRSLAVSNSPLLACLPRIISTAHPSCRIQPVRHTWAKRRMRSIRPMRPPPNPPPPAGEGRVGAGLKSMCPSEPRSPDHGRIVCSQFRRCQMPRSPQLAMTGDPVHRGRTFREHDLIARHRPGSRVASGKVRTVMWFGRTTQPSM